MRNYSKYQIYINPFLLGQLLNNSSKRNIIIRDLNLIIDESFIGKKVKLYTGQVLLPLLINKFMVGFRFGEFVFSRKRVKHKKSKKS